jgi:hypothetical protein
LKSKLLEHPVNVISNTTVLEIASGGEVTLLDRGFRKFTLQVDNVILAAVDPALSPYEELAEGGMVVTRIGDHKQVRNLRAAVWEGADAGLTLDRGCRLNANHALVSLLPTEVDLRTSAAIMESEELPVAEGVAE